MKILVDHRERASGIVKELGKKGFDVDVKQLISADFVVETRDRAGNVLTVGIEKKTQSDFIASIIDRRIVRQLVMLKENFSIPLLIIEGSENIYTLRDFHPNAIRGMLASIAIDFQIPIVHTKNYRDTASLLEVIAKRMDKPRSALSLLKKKKPSTRTEQQEYLIESLPSIGPTLAKALLKHFKNPLSIFTASKEELKEVEKIGDKKAEEIKTVIEEFYKEAS